VNHCARGEPTERPSRYEQGQVNTTPVSRELLLGAYFFAGHVACLLESDRPSQQRCEPAYMRSRSEPLALVLSSDIVGLIAPHCSVVHCRGTGHPRGDLQAKTYRRRAGLLAVEVPPGRK